MNAPFRLPDTAELSLPATPAAASAARRFAAAVLGKWDAEHLADACTLVISELIANSIRATGTLASARRARAADSHPGHEDPPIILRLTLTAAQVLAEVWDSSQQPPAPAPADQLDETGRGLLLVSAYASAWHWYPATSGKVVWAAFDLPGTARSACTPMPAGGLRPASVQGSQRGWHSRLS